MDMDIYVNIYNNIQEMLKFSLIIRSMAFQPEAAVCNKKTINFFSVSNYIILRLHKPWLQIGNKFLLALTNYNYIFSIKILICNKGNVPAFITKYRWEVLDATIVLSSLK